MGEVDPGKPLLFVAMPFGVKIDPAANLEVDFDALYASYVRPAAEKAGLGVIRADEEMLGGLIHRPMYERLLLAEVVVADLTFANPNVFYELGVRHAARPWATVLICAKGQDRPVDVAPLRSIPYELDEDGGIAGAEDLGEALTEQLRSALGGKTTDSPLFQLLDDYPGVVMSPRATEAFRERAIRTSDLVARAYRARTSTTAREGALRELIEIEKQIVALPEGEEELFASLMLAHRALESWDEMIRIAESLPAEIAAAAGTCEQLALALNRRNGRGDRARAIELLEELLAAEGTNSETLGILGRCHKDRWREKQAGGDPGAEDALDAAIAAYGDGFEADPRDYYPGVNLLTLLACRRRTEDIERIEEVAPVVAFAVARRGGLGARDYWALATIVEISALRGRETEGRRALSAAIELDAEGWMTATTADNLEALSAALPLLGQPVDWVADAIGILRRP
jgi:tetratricopeptide (TPR) repeat protein